MEDSKDNPHVHPLFARILDAERNALVRAELKARDRRFTGEPLTGFGSFEAIPVGEATEIDFDAIDGEGSDL